MNYTAEQKFEALKNYLISEGAANQEELKNLTTENTYNDRYNTFEVAGDEYMVLTDEEANKAAKDEILNSLWAFNTNFILEHTEFYKTSCDREDKEFIKSLQDLQVRLCEGANAIVGALIIDRRPSFFANSAHITFACSNLLSAFTSEL